MANLWSNFIKEKLAERFEECKLELHPVKTRIVYCKDKDRNNNEELNEFDFLGYTFKAVYIKCRDGKIDIIAEILNPMIRGWMNYFGKFNPSAMKDTLQCIERRLVKWAMCKYKNFRGRRRKAEEWLCAVRKREPKLFAHWSNLYSHC